MAVLRWRLSITTANVQKPSCQDKFPRRRSRILWQKNLLVMATRVEWFQLRRIWLPSGTRHTPLLFFCLPLASKRACRKVQRSLQACCPDSSIRVARDSCRRDGLFARLPLHTSCHSGSCTRHSPARMTATNRYRILRFVKIQQSRWNSCVSLSDKNKLLPNFT